MIERPEQHPVDRPSQPRKGFTLIELLVVVAIISLLVSILLPSLNRAKNLAKDVICSTNLRGIGQIDVMYANDHAGTVAYSRLDPAVAGSGIWTAFTPFSLYTYSEGYSSPFNDLPGQQVGLFTCPSADLQDDVIHTPNVSWHDAPYAVPASINDLNTCRMYNVCYTTVYSARAGWYQPPTLLDSYKLEDYTNASQTVSFVDGKTAVANSYNVDNHLADEMSQPVNAQYRHLDREGLNLLMWDQHVETTTNPNNDRISERYQWGP